MFQLLGEWQDVTDGSVVRSISSDNGAAAVERKTICFHISLPERKKENSQVLQCSDRGPLARLAEQLTLNQFQV